MWKITEIEIQITPNGVECIFEARNKREAKLVRTDIPHLPAEVRDRAKEIANEIQKRLQGIEKEVFA